MNAENHGNILDSEKAENAENAESPENSESSENFEGSQRDEEDFHPISYSVRSTFTSVFEKFVIWNGLVWI